MESVPAPPPQAGTPPTYQAPPSGSATAGSEPVPTRPAGTTPRPSAPTQSSTPVAADVGPHAGSRLTGGDGTIVLAVILVGFTFALAGMVLGAGYRGRRAR
jgi:hypothetical protein